MSKQSEAKPDKGVVSKTFESLLESVRYFLAHEYAAPEEVIESIMEDEAQYLQEEWAESAKTPGLARKIADEIALKPSGEGNRWIRVADDEIVMSGNEQIRAYLDRLVDVGLYGEDANAAASVMLARGIEETFKALGVHYTKALAR